MSECVIDEIHRMVELEVGTRWVSREYRRGESPYPPMHPNYVYIVAVKDDIVWLFSDDAREIGVVSVLDFMRWFRKT